MRCAYFWITKKLLREIVVGANWPLSSFATFGVLSPHDSVIVSLIHHFYCDGNAFAGMPNTSFQTELFIRMNAFADESNVSAFTQFSS